MSIVHICSCCTCVYNYSRLYAFLVCQPRRLLVRNLKYVVIIIFLSQVIFIFLLFQLYQHNPKTKEKQKLPEIDCKHLLPVNLTLW